jgi:hypothetical protein
MVLLRAVPLFAWGLHACSLTVFWPGMVMLMMAQTSKLSQVDPVAWERAARRPARDVRCRPTSQSTLIQISRRMNKKIVVPKAHVSVERTWQAHCCANSRLVCGPDLDCVCTLAEDVSRLVGGLGEHRPTAVETRCSPRVSQLSPNSISSEQVNALNACDLGSRVTAESTSTRSARRQKRVSS